MGNFEFGGGAEFPKWEWGKWRGFDCLRMRGLENGNGKMVNGKTRLGKSVADEKLGSDIGKLSHWNGEAHRQERLCHLAALGGLVGCEGEGWRGWFGFG